MLSRLKLVHRLWIAALCAMLALVSVSVRYVQQTYQTGLRISERQLKALPILKDLRVLLQEVQDQRAGIPLAMLGEAPEPAVLIRNAAALEHTERVIGDEIDAFASPHATEVWGQVRETLAPILKKSTQGRLKASTPIPALRRPF